MEFVYSVKKHKKQNTPHIFSHNLTILNSAKQKGMVILVVMMFLALGTILLTNLVDSTFLQSESLGVVKDRLKAEYVLKSLINYAASLIDASESNAVDSTDSPYGPFIDGLEIPFELATFLGVEANEDARVALQITPISGFPLDRVAVQGASGNNPNSAIKETTEKYRKILLRLFKILGFDEDEEKDHTGLFNNRVFSSEEMLGNLIDYLDDNEESCSEANGITGIESQLPEKYKFKNDFSISRIGELSLIPGFTPARMRKLWPYVTVEGSRKININIAPVELLEALDDDIDSTVAQNIYDYARSEDGPFKSTSDLNKVNDVPPNIAGKLGSIIDTKGNRYEVIARIAYPNQASYFMRVTIKKGDGLQPSEIINPVIY